ncbi:MAG TPA: ATP-grasp domain-containing protein [Phycisphaerae bacterium]|nr:ATP-grasp domain-containing protein [Phycisphaerae bacterium]
MTRPTVLVIESQAKAALPVIESLHRAGIRVIVANTTWHNSGFYSRGVRERYLYPSPRHKPDDFKAWLLRFLSRRRIEVLFPIGHYGALAVSEIQEEIRRHTRLVMPDAATFRLGYEKITTMKAALAAGVPIPESWFPADLAGGIEEVIQQIRRWPVLVKPTVGVGARGITWCHNADDVRRLYPLIAEAHGESYIQDFVPPGGMQYKVDMLVDDRQQRLAAIVYGKTRMYPPEGGSSVLNFSADRPDILDLAYKMLVQLKWVGFCDFDFVDDPRDGVVKIMEINPRLPESFGIAAKSGIDFPLMIYKMARGERIEPVTDYPKNKFLRFLPGDLLWFLRVSNKERFGTWPGWFRFFDRDTAYQLVRARDPGPIMGYLLENISALFNKKLLRERLRLTSSPSVTAQPTPGPPVSSLKPQL